MMADSSNFSVEKPPSPPPWRALLQDDDDADGQRTVEDSESDCFTEDLTRATGDWRKSSSACCCFRVSSDLDSRTRFPGETVVALNAGGAAVASAAAGGLEYGQDRLFAGGDVLRTDEAITGTADPALYRTARYRNFSYELTDLPAGAYWVDLHFAEIVFTHGPPAMRVFDVHLQGLKVIAELDLYAEVGSNKALIFCVKTTVADDGKLVIAFKGVTGYPLVSALSVRRSSALSSVLPSLEKLGITVRGHTHPKVLHFTTGSLEDSVQEGLGVDAEEIKKPKKTRKDVEREHEERVEELKAECHEAWICVQDANRKIESLQMDAVSKSVLIETLASTVESQDTEMGNLKQRANGGLQKWTTALFNLRHEIKEVKSKYSVLASETKDWISSFPDTHAFTTSVQTLVREHELLKTKYSEQSLERRQLYNEVLELQGNIRVYCRCRPMSDIEMANKTARVVDFDPVKDNEITVRTGNSKKLFKFDRVFTPHDDQVAVFAQTAPVVVSVLDGYNVCIFAYGQTGTGKTFTMEGTPGSRGVNYRTLEELFRLAHDRREQFTFAISVSVLEVYNEQIRDLLAAPIPPDSDQLPKKLEIRQVAEGGHHVPGLVEAQVQSMEEVWRVLQAGSGARAVETTNANQHSSRSHCMLSVVVKGQNLMTGECTRSKLWLVDLAGSERVAKTDVQGDRLREAQSINKSLSALGDVIAALTTKSSHVPFRNSKLTHLLQDSLGGDSKTLMVVQISPSEEDVGESLCSLNFASRVRGVELGPARKQIDTSELFKFKQLAERAKQDLRAKEDVVKKLEERIHSAEFSLKVGESSHQSKVKDKEKAISDLEAQLSAEKKARLAAQAALKEKGTQLEKALASQANNNKDARGPPERRPLVEKAIHDVPVAAASNGSSPPSSKQTPTSSPVEKIKRVPSPDLENVEPQRQRGDPDQETQMFAKPVVRRKMPRAPGRASIASTYQINRASLWGSLSWEDDSKENVDRSRQPPPPEVRRERRVSSYSRPSVPSAPASALYGRKKAVHFASPVFQKEKLRGVVGNGPPAQTHVAKPGALDGGGSEAALEAAKKPAGVAKFRRVSIASRRASAQLPQRTTMAAVAAATTTGPQRVLSGGGSGVRERTRPPAVIVNPVAAGLREKRWAH